MISFDNYVKAKTVAEAYELNQSVRNVVIGGMTWLHLSDAEYDTLVDLCDLGLDRIEEEGDFLKIGSMATLSQLEESELLRGYFGQAFADCLRHIVGVQFRNSATIGGSVVSRLGFSSIITLLLPLEAKLVFHAQKDAALADFLKGGSRRDILEYIMIPKERKKVRIESVRRTSTDLPVLNVCGVKDGSGIRFAVGARPGVAVLAKEGETVGFGNDVRGSKEYRIHLYEVLRRRIEDGLKEDICG